MSGNSWSIQSLAVASLIALIFSGLVLPSDGNHGLFSIKSLTFFAALSSWILFIITKNVYSKAEIYLLFWAAVAVALLLVWLAVGSFYDVTAPKAQFDQFKVFVITVFTVTISLHYLLCGALEPQTLIVSALFANGIYSIIKLSAATFHFLGIMDILTFAKVTGLRLLSMDIHGGMIRLQTSVDIATPFLLFFMLQRRLLSLRLPSFFPVFYLAISILSILLSFSRYLIFVGLVSLALHAVTLTWRRALPGFLYAFLLGAVAAYCVGGDFMYKVIEKRLFSSDNYYSDRTRGIQIAALEEEALCYPLIGKGLGASAPGCIRDHQLTYSYEVQWVSFLMQLGLLGTLLFFMALLCLVALLLVPPYTFSKMGFLVLYLLWLLSGFTNPFLISLTSGIIYALFSAGSLILQKKAGSYSLCLRPPSFRF